MESYTGPHQSNQNYLADFIATGGTGGIGHVYEPNSGGIPRENILFVISAGGYPLVEAAYMSIKQMSWQNVVVGDPLCRINFNEPADLATRPQELSQSFSLSQNYPNPFNPITNIEFSLKKRQNIKLIIYDILGSKVETLIDALKNNGNYKIVFDGSALSSGIYYYTLFSGEFSTTKKFVLVR